MHDHRRILVVARPDLGRVLAGALRAGGYEVYRTPGDSDLFAVVARLRPHLTIVALDLPWVDAREIVQPLRAGPTAAPLLLLGEADAGSVIDDTPRLPLTVDAAQLLAAVALLVSSSRRQPG
jgi:DNA-binding response OmpR family regulator